MPRLSILVATLLMAIAAPTTQAQAPTTEVSVYAAGSLRAVLTDAAKAYEANRKDARVRFTFGASGLLKDRLLAGESADLFASANMAHPEAVQQAGRAEAPQRFARNAMCALVRPGLDVMPDTLVRHLLDPGVKVGTSTPKADPSGGYAWLLFERIERQGATGAFATLSGKALQLTGGPASPPPPGDRNVYGALVAGGQADIFITYCTNATIAVREQPALKKVAVPAAIDVSADYGLAVLRGASAPARAFAAFLLDEPGRRIFLEHGFAAP